MFALFLIHVQGRIQDSGWGGGGALPGGQGYSIGGEITEGIGLQISIENLNS